VSAPTPEELVVDTLSQLLYLSEVEDVVFCDFEVSGSGPSTLRIKARSVPLRDVVIEGPAVKAVTYHDLEVGQSESGWKGRVFFDV
jgi:SHS2 domain-containing protein